MLLNELFTRPDPETAMLDAALAAIHRCMGSKGDLQDIEGYAFDVARSFKTGKSPKELATLYRERYSTNEAIEPDEPGYQHDVLTMPKNTVVIDTPGELDWYKIGQHFPTLAQQDPHEYGQSESDMVITFANAKEKNVFLKLASRIGLKTKDIGGTPEQPEIHSEGWSEKYKRSIDCSNPKGFSQRAHCAGRKKK